MSKIEKARRAEANEIVDFQLAMALETENVTLDRETVTAGVTAVFDDPSKGSYYVAIAGGEVVGSCLTTYEWSDWRNGQVIWLQSVYIKPNFRRKGIFRAMYNHMVGLVDKGMYCGIRLYVERSNHKAQKVYQSMGMVNHHYEMFEWMKDV